MTELSVPARIWNRAALQAGGAEPGDGDKALAALLLLHGMVMNGGADHAAEVLSAEEFRLGLEGLRYFGFDLVSTLLEGVLIPAAGYEVDDINAKYVTAVPDDGTLMQAFLAKLAASPESFSPL